MDLTTIITILKYDLWQGEPRPNKTPSKTPEKHQKNTKQDTYNECIKNDNKRYKLSAELQDLTNFFVKKVYSRRSYSYDPTGRDIKVGRIALSKRTPAEIKKIIDWYFTIDKSKEHCSLASALSQHSLNLYKEQGAKDSWNKI